MRSGADQTTVPERLAQTWAAERRRLLGMAYSMLGSWADAEEVVADAGERLVSRADVQRPEAWLTTVTARLAIDRGRALRARRETYVGPWLPEPVATEGLPEEASEMREWLSLGLLRVMDALDPEDRAIYVLRQAFAVPYSEIAEVTGRSEAACRKVVSRAGARVREADAPHPEDPGLLTRLLDAVVGGEIGEVVTLLSDGAVLWTDGGGRVRAALHPIRGAEKVARFLLGITAQGAYAEPVAVEVNGGPALLLDDGELGQRLVVLETRGGVVRGMQIVGNPDKLTRISVGACRRAGADWRS